MYAGLFLTKHSGKWLGAHQKFDRMAYRQLLAHVDRVKFPKLTAILHFEGKNGPDALDIKSGAKGMPGHFYDPLEGRGAVLDEIGNHYSTLVDKLRHQDAVRAAFEASWLAHAITDGLTPAHHFPYREHVALLRGTQTVKKVSDKVIVPGATRTQTFRKTWKLIGAKGLLSTHMHFELGVAAAVATMRSSTPLDLGKLAAAQAVGPVRFFKDQARAVAMLSLYESFYRGGWTVELARQVRKVLAPTIAETIAITWLLAYQEAGHKLRTA